MKDYLQEYEKQIKKKHSISWIPKWQKKFETSITPEHFLPIALKAIKDLEWDVVFQDDNCVEAKYPLTTKHHDNPNLTPDWIAKITVVYQQGITTVKSVTLEDAFWDSGLNSKNVQLFIYAFETVQKNTDKEELDSLKTEIDKSKNWDDYVIPESLPKPIEQPAPKTWMKTVGIAVLSIVIGIIWAVLQFHLTYILFLFDFGAGWLVGYGFKYILKLSYDKKLNNLDTILAIGLIITFFTTQYTFYELIRNEYNDETTSFILFLILRFKAGVTVSSINFGWIGLVILWCFRLGFTWILVRGQILGALSQYIFSIVPMEVVDFAFYHFVKEKTEEQVREELSKMGWNKHEDQDDVFTAVYLVHNIHQEIRE